MNLAMRRDDTFSTSSCGMQIRKEFGMRSIQQSLTTGHGDGGGAPFIPMRAARRYFEAKKT